VVTTNYETTDTVGGDLPVPIGGGHAAAGQANSHADVFIDGLALNLHITPNTSAYGGAPYKRETADQTKPQYDTSPLAGEHTLSSYWMRSQMSLHGGAGIKYLDTSQADLQSAQSATELRYDDSRGIDVWTKGEIKRLPDTTLLAATAGKTWCFATSIGTESYVVYGSASTVKAQRQNAADTITYTVTGMTGTIKDMVIDGTHYYVATSDGKIFSGPIDNSAAGAAQWTFSSVSDVTLGWVKQRLMAGIDNSIYELAGTGPALPTATYAHPNAGWRWSDFAESPNAIVAAGWAGTVSTLFSFTIDTSTGVPELQPGIPIAQLPVGEQILALYNYTGETLAIGTSVGLRIGVFQSFYGTFSYGSLTFPSRLEDAAPVTSISGRGSFVYAGTTIDGEASLIRVDLGTQTDQNIFAWAPDLRGPTAHTGSVTSITCDSSLRLRFTVDNYGLVGEVPGSFTGRDAWLRTAKIRFNTVEPKHFKYAQYRSEGAGTVTVSAQSDTTPLAQVYTAHSGEDSLRFQLTPGPAEWVQLTFDLTENAVLTSYQVLALPAGPRNRLITLPVQIFDRERSRHGITISSPGRAKSILDTLEAYESNGDELTLQVPCLGIDAVRVTVEKFTFQQTSNPTPNKKVDVGGYGTLVFRTTT
jgi:hypothetical protein